jgi:serine/threonine-protein kinase
MQQSSAKGTPDRALRETRGYGDAEDGGASLTSAAVDAVGETAFANGPSSQPSMQEQPRVTVGATRTTVLPRRKRAAADAGADWHVEEKPRFETVELLGRGGMGEVTLAKDNDIRRTVAVKRLIGNKKSEEAMLRFADEVRAVGQLEHPGIVPVYDVGVDDGGQHYLVMKHVQGDTLEHVIEKLKANAPEYALRFTPQYRAHIFLEILQAIRYAHDHGIIHRDIKPANIMIGAFGEVTVMDWGLAKKIDRTKNADDAKQAIALAKTAASGEGKLLETMHGALIGTPLYMSPEQAAGKNDELDERSDVFSLCLLFFEMLTLHHPLEKLTTVQEVLASLIAKEIDLNALAPFAFDSDTPVEYLRYLVKGLSRDREQRFASVAVMESGLQQILAGKMPVACHLTLAKRAAHGFTHWLDRHPKLFTLMTLGGVLAALAAIVFGIIRLVQAIAS